MYSRFQLAKKYIHYYLTASNGKGYGIHSPFVFDFVIHVLSDRRHFYAYDTIESLRNELSENKSVVAVEDYGAGSAVHSKQRSVSSIVKSAAKNKKLSQLLFRIVQYYQPANILELGTSLGISSAYMAAANPAANVITVEGASSVAGVAIQNHQLLGLDNIQVINGKFDDILPGLLQQIKTVDLGFVDDIHWSPEMEEAWRIIRQHDAVAASIDLFFFGIVLFRSEFKSKQHFTIRF
jgi:predicted O-methyltransferase YrrM